MMRRMFSVGLAAALALCVAGTASAATSIDLLFSGAAGSGTQVTITPNFGGLVTLNVFMTTDDAIEIVSVSVVWDNSDTVPTLATQEWFGLGFTFPDNNFIPIAPGWTQVGNKVTSFDGKFPPSLTQVLPAGTYQLGTVVFNDLGDAGWSTTNVSIGPLTGVDGVGILGGIDIGGLVTFNPSSVTINVVPEPGTASLLGLGLVGLILAGRRKRA